MNVYEVKLYATKEANFGQESYNQACEAEDSDGTVLAYWYNDRHEANMIYNILVLSKSVRCESASGAIMKFKRWQNNGLDESYLMSNST